MESAALSIIPFGIFFAGSFKYGWQPHWINGRASCLQARNKQEQEDGILATSKNSQVRKYGGALLSGPVSRSDDTIRVHRLARDGHATEKEFLRAILQDRETIQKSQEGFAFVSSGQCDWLDILRPIALSFQGFQKRATAGEDSAGPVTRWFRTNTFYRRPLVSGRISANGDELGHWLPPVPAGNPKGVAFLPGPYSFARLVEDSYYKNGKGLSLDYSSAIAKNIPGMAKLGYGCILFLEPSVGYDISLGGQFKPDWIISSLAEIKRSCPQMALGVHFPLADAKQVLPALENSAADIFGIDAIYTGFRGIKTSKQVLLGVVDGARAGIESADYLAKQSSLFLEETGFSGTYYLGCNDRLSDVPFQSAIGKIRALASFKPGGAA